METTLTGSTVSGSLSALATLRELFLALFVSGGGIRRNRALKQKKKTKKQNYAQTQFETKFTLPEVIGSICEKNLSGPLGF